MKVKRRQYKSWDEEHEDVRIRLAEARLSLKRTRSSLKEAESERDRMTRLHLIASKKVDDTRAEQMSVQRLLDESKHKREDATHRGLPRYRWDADVRRLESQADRMSDELRRREDDRRVPPRSWTWRSGTCNPILKAGRLKLISSARGSSVCVSLAGV